MKTIMTALIMFGSAISAFAQFDASKITVGINGNYTMYKGNFDKAGMGAQVRVGYAMSEKISTHLGFTYTMPIIQESSVLIADDNGNTIDVPSEISYKFKTISLIGSYHLIGDNETSGSLYAQFGPGLVLVSYKEDITGSYDKTTYLYPQNQVEKTSEMGFTLNFGIGGQYRIGKPIVFAEVGYALPANTVNEEYVENVIPSHLMFNFGVKLPLGSSK